MTAGTQSDEMLRLAVVDEEDLAVVSANLQDSRLSLADVTYLPSSRRFAAVVSRIDWLAFTQGRQQRRHAGFHFERVLRVQRSGFRDDESGPMQLLAIGFEPKASPAGDVLLTFAGGRMIKLEVECLEAEMRDLSACWPVEDCPRHRLDEAEVDR